VAAISSTIWKLSIAVACVVSLSSCDDGSADQHSLKLALPAGTKDRSIDWLLQEMDTHCRAGTSTSASSSFRRRTECLS
jgi:hypothetical protein